METRVAQERACKEDGREHTQEVSCYRFVLVKPNGLPLLQAQCEEDRLAD